MNRQEALDQFVSWLREVATDFSFVEVEEDGPDDTYFAAGFFTDTNHYRIDCHYRKDFLGCTAEGRKPRAGEKHARGNNLPHGPVSQKTWNSIVNAILKYETQDLQARPPRDLSKALSGNAHDKNCRKYKLFPVQKWLVSMPFAGDKWEKSCSIYADEWIHRGKRGPFKIFHFDTGRRSGKSLMAREMILKQMEILANNLAAGDLVSLSEDGTLKKDGAVIGMILDNRAAIANIIHVLPDRRLRDDAQKAMLKDLHDCGFDPHSRGEVTVIGSVHIHYVAATDREWYAGRRYENPVLVCIEDSGYFNPDGLMIATNQPPTRIVILGDQPEGQLLHLLDRPDAISMKFPAPAVNQLLIPNL